MGRRRGELQNAFTRGELDPELRERIDLTHYYLAVESARNQVALLQGGLARAPGTVATGQRLRRRVEPITGLSGSDITAANGGTAGNLVDQDASTVFTTNVVSGDPFTVFEVDLGSDQDICFVDIIGFSAGSSARDDCVAVQYHDGSAWQDFGGPAAPGGANVFGGLIALAGSARKGITTSDRTRRFASVPGADVMARNWRMIITGGSGPGAISVKGVRFWRERGDLSPVRIVAFEKSQTEAYELVITDRNIDAFKRGVYVGSANIPLSADFIPEMTHLQSLDTMLVFHEEMHTWRIVRQGADDEWNADALGFDNVPDLSPSTAFSGSQNEIQEIIVEGWETGDTLVLWDGDRFVAVTHNGDDNNFAGDIGTALVGSSDFGLATESDPLVITVFYIASAAQRQLAGVWLEPSAGTVTTRIVQKGLNASGKLMADDTGWPRCGAIVQSRLWLGGFRAAPSTYAFSRTAQLFDFTDSGSPVTADMGLVNTIDSDQVETINHVFVGQNLQIFTSVGEWWIENRTIDATQPLNVILAHRYGIARGVAPKAVQGATVFMQDGGEIDGVKQPVKVVRDMLFDIGERNNYTAEPLSLLGPHVLTDVTGMVHRPGVTTREASLVMFINTDGTAALLTLMRSQEVIAMTPRDTPGKFRAAMTDISRNVWLAVEREADGREDLWLERMDDGALMDAQVSRTGSASVTVTNLDHLEGRDDVWVYADGDLFGPFTVTGGEITLDDPASETIAGLHFELEGKTLPAREELQDGIPIRPPMRVYEAEWSLKECGPFEMRANGASEWVEVPIRWLGGAPPRKEATGEEPEPDLDTPLLERKYTGYMRVENLKGWTRQGQIEWRQTRPLPFKIRALRYKVVS